MGKRERERERKGYIMQDYIANTLLWHSGLNCYVQPGEAVNLDHLSPEERAVLEAQGAVLRTPNPNADGSDVEAPAHDPEPEQAQA